MMADGAWTVLLKKADAFDPPAVSKALAAHRKVPALDTAAEAKRCWGVVAEGLAAAAAQELVRALAAQGLEAALVLDGSAPPAPPAARAVKEDWTGLPWAEVCLVAAAAFPRAVSSTVTVKEGPDAKQRLVGLGLMLVTGIPVRVGPKAREVTKTVESAEPVFYLDVALGRPVRRLRVDGQSFDYSVLGAAMGPSVLQNFKTLVAAAAAQAPAAARGRGTRILIEGRPLREMGYAGLDDLDRECRWLLALSGLA